MAGLFNQTVYKRLPVFAREMDKTDQDIFVFLRLRKGVHYIAHELGFSHEETEKRVQSILHILACNDSLHLIKNPEFVSIPGEGEKDREGSSQERHLADAGPSLEDETILSQFLRNLSVVLKEISPEENNLLKLYFHHQWTREEILAFYQKAPFPLPHVSGKTKGYSKTDISKALYETIKNLLMLLRQRLGEGEEQGSPQVEHLKTILEEIGHQEEIW